MRKKRNKYRNVRCEVNGIKFDSRKEMKRYSELSVLLRTGLIADLVLQPEFKISSGGSIDPATGRKMAARKYRADFMYFDRTLQKTVVEDVKSSPTARDKTYRLKRQLFIELYGDMYKF
ncbi:MAG TPA: DUF1064 domain-containing protein, partial [Desulfobacterales bacterium]|nr:DUF1064 domain-containing protein [Desulfobacterales bacterium]